MQNRSWMRWFCLAPLFLLVNAASDRMLKTLLNPGCTLGPDHCAHFGHGSDGFLNNLLYVVSDSTRANNTDPRYKIYWSTIGAPTVMITEISPNADENDPGIAWMDYIEDKTPEIPFFTPQGTRYAAFTLVNLVEWDDVNNTGILTKDANTTVQPFADANWYNVSLKPEANGIFATFTGTFGQNPQANNITIELRAHMDSSRAALPPRMLVAPNSVTMRIVLNQTTVHYNHSRFALDMVFASNDSSRRPATHYIDRSISDEFSPGIFTMEKISGSDTYLQWRPVVYTAANPGVSDSTRSQTGSLRNATANILNITLSDVPYSLLLGLSGINDPGNTLLRFNISLGQTDDSFYNSTVYQDWTCELGLGQAPVEAPTSKIKLIIGIGFGVPAALILIGVVYVAYLKIKRRRRDKEASLLVTETTTTYQTLG